MPKNRIPSYRHHKPTGQAVVTLCGADIYLGPYNSPKSRAEYDRLIKEWLANGRRLPRDEEAGFTINELILAYWEHCERHYRKNGKPTSQQWKIKSALGPVRRLYGDTQADEFGPLALKACRLEMIEKGWVRKTINSHVDLIRQMFKWAAENELVSASVYEALGTVAGLRKGRTDAAEGEKVQPVPDTKVDAVRPFVSRQVWAMIELQRLTAMRPGEVVMMRTGDIDMSGPVWIYTPAEHKTEHHDIGREIYLGPQAQAIVRPFLKADRQASLFSPRDAEDERRETMRENRKTPVQPSQQNRRRRKNPKRPPGEAYTTNSYRHAITRACELAFEMPAELRRRPVKPKKATKAELAKFEAERERLLEQAAEWRKENCWSPNQLRHNAATKARRESGLDVSQILCGHTKADTTQIYAEVDRLKAMEYMSRHG